MKLKKKFFIIISSIGLLTTAVYVYRYFFKSWSPYYQQKLYKEPRPLLTQALNFLEQNKEKKALDLGAGVGNDTAYLLKNGWEVWANDVEKEAIELISSRRDIAPYKNKLMLIHKGFSELPWDNFPQFNLIYAGYSLPFARPNEFMNMWNQIRNHLTHNGVFAGHFFGPDHNGFNAWTKSKMSFFTKDDLIGLLEGLKIIVLEEYYEKASNGSIDHSFDVIARKI